MDIPYGFQLDPQSGLYYKEEDGWDADAGAPVRIVTWLDLQSGATQEVRYPAAPAEASIPQPASSPIIEIPQGFEPYPGSNLYYRCEGCVENGVPVQRVTYYDPVDASYHQVDYPAQPPEETLPPHYDDTPTVQPEEEMIERTTPPEAEEELSISEAVAQLPPLDEAVQLLDPPPEPLLIPTGLPEHNPYAAEQTYPPEPPPMFEDAPPEAPQEIYYAPGTQPLPEKKSKVAIIAAAASVMVLAVIGICGWQFGWFGGQSAPVDGSISSPPTVSTPDAPSETPSDVPDASEPAVPSEDEQGTPSQNTPDIDAVGVEISYISPTTADITLTNLSLEKSYPASLPGRESNAMLYYWGVSFGDYEVALALFSGDELGTGTLTTGDMQADVWERKTDGGYKTISQLDYTVSDHSVTFHHVVLPAESGIDFSASSVPCSILAQVGDMTSEKETQAKTQQGDGFAISDDLLGTHYRYANEQTGMEVVLELDYESGTFQLAADLGGSTYHISGGFTVDSDGTLILEGSGPPAPIWKGGARFQLQPDGGLLLESPENVGVLSAGEALMPA